MTDQCPSLETTLKRARQAQALAATWSQDEVDDLVAAVGWAAWQEGGTIELARRAIAESGLGRAKDLAERHRNRVLGLLSDLHHVSSCGLIEEDIKLGLKKYAQPIGIVAVAIPATAPTAAVACNALNILKTRNAAVFCPNPRAAGVATAMTEILRRAIDSCGAPADLLQCLERPDRDVMRALMAESDLVIATGGRGVVNRAQAGSTPSYTAGVGNAVILVDETADLETAAGKILTGKSFDNGTSCSAESVLVIQESVWPAMIEALVSKGGYLCSASEAERLARSFWPEGAEGTRPLIGRSALEIAQCAGIPLGGNTRALMVAPEEPLGSKGLFWGEKLAPILAVCPYRSFEDGVECLNRLLQNSGLGHSCGIFSRIAGRAEHLARTLPVGRVMCNQSTGLGNTGSPNNGMPFTMTLSCGSWSGDLTADNIGWRHLVNVTWLSQPIDRSMPAPVELFGRHYQEHSASEAC